jgi:hypothetical protein
LELLATTCVGVGEGAELGAINMTIKLPASQQSSNDDEHSLSHPSLFPYLVQIALSSTSDVSASSPERAFPNQPRPSDRLFTTQAPCLAATIHEQPSSRPRAVSTKSNTLLRPSRTLVLLWVS